MLECLRLVNDVYLISKLSHMKHGPEIRKKCFVQVLDFIGAKEIPAKHIVKRWTRDACDVLPPHLIQYQKDSIQNNPLSYRHFMMYLHAMDLVRLGDTSVEAYNRLL